METLMIRQYYEQLTLQIVYFFLSRANCNICVWMVVCIIQFTSITHLEPTGRLLCKVADVARQRPDMYIHLFINSAWIKVVRLSVGQSGQILHSYFKN